MLDTRSAVMTPGLWERFWDRVDVGEPDVCWPWTAGKGETGYGHFQPIRNLTLRAHRLAYEYARGTFRRDLHVLHSCDNPSCCNPAHLWLGTRFDNQQDAVAKGRHRGQKRTHCPRGHAYTPENTYCYGGKRECRQCHNDRRRATRQAIQVTA